MSVPTDKRRDEIQVKASTGLDTSGIDDSDTSTLPSPSASDVENNTKPLMSYPYVKITADEAHFKKVSPGPEKMSQATEGKSTYPETFKPEHQINHPLQILPNVKTLDQIVLPRSDDVNTSNDPDIANQSLHDVGLSTQLISSAKEVESEPDKADTSAKGLTISVDASPDVTIESKREKELLTEDDAISNDIQSQEESSIIGEGVIDCTSEVLRGASQETCTKEEVSESGPAKEQAGPVFSLQSSRVILDSIPQALIQTQNIEVNDDKQIELVDIGAGNDEKAKLLAER